MNTRDLMRLIIAGFGTLIFHTLHAETQLEVRGMSIGETQYRVLMIPVQRLPDLQLVWLGSEERTFVHVAAHLEKEGLPWHTMMNAGIFEPGGRPTGLTIIDGEVLTPLNLDEGRGNFFLKPNGVFLVSAGKAEILTSEEFAAQQSAPQLALQSGPLLLREGQIHPQFRKESSSRLHRNGIGVDESGNVHWVITELGQEHQPNLYEFAEAFRQLGCADALFLDGDLSQMLGPDELSSWPGNHLGAFLVIFEGK
ncbi:MAG: phosphodiester glycosidase family protein [Verrucomicrobiales bacterium]